MDAHRQIAEAARVSCDHAHGLLLAARLTGATRADVDTLADYADDQRDRWLRASERARREEDRRHEDRHRVDATLAALDYGAGDEYGFGPLAPDDEDFFASLDRAARSESTR